METWTVDTSGRHRRRQQEFQSVLLVAAVLLAFTERALSVHYIDRECATERQVCIINVFFTDWCSMIKVV